MTPKQIGLVHVARRQLKFSDDDYRNILRALGGVDSSKDLDAAGFERVMAYFTAWGFRSTWTRRTYGKRAGMASPHQVELIRALWGEWSAADDQVALNRWLEKSFKVSALRFLDSATAAKAINGLRAMVRRKSSKPAA